MPEDLNKNNNNRNLSYEQEQELLRRQREGKVSEFKLDIDLSDSNTHVPRSSQNRSGKAQPNSRNPEQRNQPSKDIQRRPAQPATKSRQSRSPVVRPPQAQRTSAKQRPVSAQQRQQQMTRPQQQGTQRPPAGMQQRPQPRTARPKSEQVPLTQTTKQRKPKKAKKSSGPTLTTAKNWVFAIIYILFVLISSGILIYFGITGALDFIGFKDKPAPVTIKLTQEESKDISKVTDVLSKAGIIDQPVTFRLYCKFSGTEEFKADQEFKLTRNMGYKTIINTLKTVTRETVRVTFPEGKTVVEFAEKLESENVCSKDEFLEALNNEDFSEFAFVNDIPDGAEYKYRYQKFEGFLFPDTYDFYIESTGKAAAEKILREGFNRRIPFEMRIKMQNEGLGSVYDTIIVASIIEWESPEKYMGGISQVIHNRLAKPDEKEYNGLLQCDSTYRYLDTFVPKKNKDERQKDNTYFQYYDTYQRKGLPIAPICNPGLKAINAAMEPDTKNYGSYYYFASDDKSNTYFSKTFAEHQRILKKHGIGVGK